MSLLDTVEPDAYLVPNLLDFAEARAVHFSRAEEGKHLTDAELIDHLQGTVSYRAEVFSDSDEVEDKFGVKHRTIQCYSHETVESLLSQCRKEALLEAVEVCKTIANDAEDCGATPEMLEIIYAVEDELRRMAEGEK